MNGKRAEYFGHRRIGKKCGKCPAIRVCEPPYCVSNPGYREDRAAIKREMVAMKKEICA